MDKLAVNDISFGLEYGEWFALLGISDVGKSRCFKYFSGELDPSTGSIPIFGNYFTISECFQKARKMLRCYLQFDTIFDALTVRKHLEIYSTIKGIKSDLKEQIIKK